MKKILSASEMKLVCGGAVSSSYCNSGELLYTCTTDFGNGITSTGAVCSSNANNAASAVLDVNPTSGIKVTCK